MLFGDRETCLLVQLLNENIGLLHVFDSLRVVLFGPLDSKVDLVLAESVLDLLSNAILLLADVVLLLDGELVICTHIDGSNSLMGVISDEVNHRLQDRHGLSAFHIVFIRYIIIIHFV